MSVLAAWAAPLIDEIKKARPATKSAGKRNGGPLSAEPVAGRLDLIAARPLSRSFSPRRFPPVAQVRALVQEGLVGTSTAWARVQRQGHRAMQQFLWPAFHDCQVPATNQYFAEFG
jgi:hypothetical protein